MIELRDRSGCAPDWFALMGLSTNAGSGTASVPATARTVSCDVPAGTDCLTGKSLTACHLRIRTPFTSSHAVLDGGGAHPFGDG